VSAIIETYPAPAKLNLLLQVTGRRVDGYHLLHTVFRFIDFGDRLAFTLRNDGAITRSNPLPGVAAEQDLTVRAARLLQRVGKVSQGVEIRLDKQLPLGGGLGGGSSDAATTLLALNRLWGVHLRRTELQQLALELGADVPVFVFGEAALATGVGEQLQPLALPLAWYLVLLPPVAVSTAEIFQAADLKRDSNPIRIPAFSVVCGPNDLEPVVCQRYPEVARHLAWLRQFGSAAMTGSGAAVFAGFENAEAAQRVHQQLPADMRGVVARGLDRHPLWRMCE
jgi:4-diphosphocytidyl-2-C-methyl-D-erythritol kinase